MALEPSEVSLIFVVIVAVIGLMAAWTLASLKRQETKEKPKPKHSEEKPKPQPPSKPVAPNPCLLAGQGGYVGILRKEWKDKGQFPPQCYEKCPFFLKCVGVKEKE